MNDIRSLTYTLYILNFADTLNNDIDIRKGGRRGKQ